MRRLAGRLAAPLADALAAASGAAMGVILLVLVTLDVAQVVLRYAFGIGWPWAGDLTIILLLTLAWIGAGHLWLRGAHIAVNLLSPRPGRIAAASFAAVALGAVAVVVPMAWEAVRLYAAIDLPALPLPAAAKFVPVLAGLVWLGAAIVLRAAAGRDAHMTMDGA